jgi:hypothetical protein
MKKGWTKRYTEIIPVLEGHLALYKDTHPRADAVALITRKVGTAVSLPPSVFVAHIHFRSSSPLQTSFQVTIGKRISTCLIFPPISNPNGTSISRYDLPIRFISLNHADHRKQAIGNWYSKHVNGVTTGDSARSDIVDLVKHVVKINDRAVSLSQCWRNNHLAEVTGQTQDAWDRYISGLAPRQSPMLRNTFDRQFIAKFLNHGGPLPDGLTSETVEARKKQLMEIVDANNGKVRRLVLVLIENILS